ncbi:UbiA prenyltransferase family protein [Micromonospora sp. NPDC048935]|uniref:UbiA prenyltransferase family protein n=1 Tax=Micromonospora sp. NPDC048935 TaxID=3364262 RepID=UPI003718BD15
MSQVYLDRDEVALVVRQRTRLRDLVTLIRPVQWVKSLLVVPLPLLERGAWTLDGLVHLLGAIMMFILASAVVYVGNDIADRERDRRHPTKRQRPIASGRVSVAVAAGYWVGLLALLVVLLVTVMPVLMWPLAGYLVLNIAYSRWLKHVPMVDMIVVAAGFELRILAGYLAVDVRPSGWLLQSIFLLCLLPILAKRRREFSLPEEARRPVIGVYSAEFIDQLLVLCAGLTTVTFLFYINERMSSHADLASVLLLPLLLFGLFRYLHVVGVKGGSADPVHSLLRDRALVIGAGLFMLAAASASFVLS